MRSLTHNFLNSLQLTPIHAASIRRIGECKGRQDLFRRQTPEILQTLQTRARIESTESSNRLEGVLARKGRVEDLVLNDDRPQDRSEQEIAGYRDALALIHESAEHMPFSVNVIKQLHQMVYSYLPEDGGNWKPTQNDIVERDADGNVVRVRFRPMSPVETPQAMEDLEEAYLRAVEGGPYGRADRLAPGDSGLPLHPPVPRRERPRRPAADIDVALPLRLRGWALHQPRARDRRLARNVLRSASGKFRGLARG